MQLLNNLAAVVAASSILILDSSEQNTMQYSAGDVNCDEFTTILKWTYVNNDNQKWTLAGGPFSYQILSPECGRYWSYLGQDTGAFALHSQIVARSINASSSFQFSAVNGSSSGPWNIIETSSGLAVTAWDFDSRTIEPTAPMTLEQLTSDDTRQQFWLATAPS